MLSLSRNYVDEATAQNLNLAYATSNTFIMRADDTTVLSSSGLGRDSVRIRSNNQYTTHVAVYACPPVPDLARLGDFNFLSGLIYSICRKGAGKFHSNIAFGFSIYISD